MRSARKPARHNKQDDAQFERLYAGVPADGRLYDHADSSATHSPKKKKTKKQRPLWQKIIRRTLLVLLLLVLLAGLYVGGKFVYNGVKLFGWDGFLSLFTTRELKGESSGRVNILLAGNSGDQPGHGGAELTDSIIVASINTRDKTGYLLSIPRDLYVDIPGYGYGKINEAYPAGERHGFSEPGYPRGGMGLLSKTVTEDFGIKLHYYALVNYTALEQAVDAVGGIDLVIDSSDSRGIYDPSRDLRTGGPLVDLPNGPVSLNGHMALNLARARGNAYGSYGLARSDFDRSRHQRQIIVALGEKATTMQSLTNPLTLGKLFDAIGGNVETDMTMGEARRLYIIMREIKLENLVSVGLNDIDGEGTNLLQSYRTTSGQSALVPRAGIDDYSEIQTFIQSLR